MTPKQTPPHEFAPSYDMIQDLAFRCLEENEELKKRIAELETALRHCGALAGHPNPAEGCRHICNEVKEALSQSTQPLSQSGEK